MSHVSTRPFSFRSRPISRPVPAITIESASGSQEFFNRTRGGHPPVLILSGLLHMVLTVVALIPLYDAYETPRLFIVGAAASLISGLVVLLAVLRRWAFVQFAMVWLIAWLFSGVIAIPRDAAFGFLPSLEYIGQVSRGVFTVWKQVLTVEPPFMDDGHLLLLPFFIAWSGAALSTYLATHATKYPWASATIAALLIISILFSTDQPTAVALVASSVTLTSVAWLAWRQGQLQLRRIISLVAVLAVATVSINWVAQSNPLREERLVLRDYVRPPVLPFDYPSPLSGFRQFVDQLDDTELFTVQNLPESQGYLRLAAMDTFDGRAWSVSSQPQGPQEGFNAVGASVQQAPEDIRAHITVNDYSMVWVPNVGGTVDVEFAGERSETLRRSFYYNRASDTGFVNVNLQPGDSYTLTATEKIIEIPADTQDLVISPVNQPPLTAIPSEISQLAQEYSGDAATDYEKIKAVEQKLASSGGFSHGLAGEMPSLPGHGLARLNAMVREDVLVGDQEQYAALMGLMVRSLGYPARVVMGFELSGDAGTVVGENATAWVEVPFEGLGWVPFYPTPDPDQRPTTEFPDQVDQPEPQVIQPPEPPHQIPQPAPQDQEEGPAADEPHEQRDSWRLLLIAGVIALPLLGVAAMLLAILAAKRRRRRRRQSGEPDAQVVGAWDEYIDQMHDAGHRIDPAHTRKQISATGSPRLQKLARLADTAAYGAMPTGSSEPAEAWKIMEQEVGQEYATFSRWQRLKALFTIRSLRKK